MKLNWAERLSVNNPARVLEQRAWMGILKNLAPLPKGRRVLEIGCGRGAGARLILREFAPRMVAATDLDEKMLALARRYLAAGERSRISLAAADAAALPFADEAFGAVFGFGVLHHLPDWRAGVAEVSRVLAPGGVYYLEELYPSLYANVVTKHILLHPREDRFGREDLMAALDGAGLALAGSREMPLVGILAAAVKRR